MTINKYFCGSLYLIYRSLLSTKNKFAKNIESSITNINFKRKPIKNSDDLYLHLKNEVTKATLDGKAALMLSGGIDSAILANFMPPNSQTYTFQCIVPNKQVTDETGGAKFNAKRNNLKNDVINIYWEDFENFAPKLMKQKGAPIHSIEVQIYKAALEAKKNGFTKAIFGENADIIYGGMDGLLAKDWLLGEFIERYAYIMPYKVLKNPFIPIKPFLKYEEKGHIDAYKFINEYFRLEALGTYQNACKLAGIEFVGPFSTSYMDTSIDFDRIRSGDTKYLVREVYRKITSKNTDAKTNE